MRGTVLAEPLELLFQRSFLLLRLGYIGQQGTHYSSHLNEDKRGRNFAYNIFVICGDFHLQSVHWSLLCVFTLSSFSSTRSIQKSVTSPSTGSWSFMSVWRDLWTIPTITETLSITKQVKIYGSVCNETLVVTSHSRRVIRVPQGFFVSLVHRFR